MSSSECEKVLQTARLNLAQGQLEEAVGQASEAIRLDAKAASAYLVRAECHRRLKRPERALADLAVAIRLDPNQPGPYVIRAEILKRRNQFDQAIADATHALTIDPRNAAAFSTRAECRSAIGDKEGADEDVQEMLLIDPTRPVPNLQAKSASGDPSTTMAVDDERFWKKSGLKGSDDRSVFADGKPVDKSYRSRQVVGDDDAPEVLGVASGYKPGTISAPLRRHRAARKNAQGTPILLGIVFLGLLGSGYLLMSLNRSAEPLKKQDQLAVANKTELQTMPSVSEKTRVAPERAEPAPKSLVSQKSSIENNPATSATFPSIEGTQRLEGHTGVVLGLAFSPDSNWLASASGDSTVRLWNVAGDQVDNTSITLGTNSSQHPKAFINVAFSPDGRHLVASNMDGRIFLWDASVTPPKLIRTLEKHDDPVVAIAFSPDSKSLATGGRNKGLVCVWDLSDPSFPIQKSISPEKNGVWSLTFSPDGKSLLEGVSFPKPGQNNPAELVTPGQIWVWDATQRPFVKKSIVRNSKGAFPRTIVFSPDGSNIAYGDGPVVRVRDLKTDQQVCTFENHTKAVTSVAYTPDGKYLLSGAYDKTARLWDAKTGKQVLEYGDANEAVEPVAISPGGHLFAVAGHDKVIRLVRLRMTKGVRSRERTATLSERTGSATSPIGKWVELRPGTPVGDRVRTFLADGTLILQTPKDHGTGVGIWHKEAEKIYFRESSQGAGQPPPEEKWFTISAQDDQSMTILMMGIRKYIWYKSS